MGTGESNGAIVPMKQGNSDGPWGGKGVARQRSEEGNVVSTPRLDLEATYTKLRRLSELAKQDPTLQFTSVAHLLNVDLLGDAYRRLRKDASPGIDGLTAQEYEQNLEENLHDLHRRLREGRYRAQPARRVYIEQEGKQRPLGLLVLEDKIVQRAVALVLDAIMSKTSCRIPTGIDLAEDRRTR